VVCIKHLDLGDQVFRAIIAATRKFIRGNDPLMVLNDLWEVVEKGGRRRAAHQH